MVAHQRYPSPVHSFKFSMYEKQNCSHNENLKEWTGDRHLCGSLSLLQKMYFSNVFFLNKSPPNIASEGKTTYKISCPKSLG